MLYSCYSVHCEMCIAMSFTFKLLFALLPLLLNVKCEDRINLQNNRPIIGILTQEQSYYLDTHFPGQYNSYIAASYVKAVESAGARVVPIWIGQKRAYYKELLSKINGVLFPGGGTYFNQSNGYADAGEHIFNITKGMNNNGIYFPLWGTCLGFELLPYLDAKRIEFRADCKADDITMPLVFTQDYRTSRLFADAPDDVIRILATQNVTSNYHNFCITKKILLDYKLKNNWKVITLNEDINGFSFISTFEHFRYPIYGVQFHPEKNIFEWKSTKVISHTEDAVKANRYFMDFFVSEARRNVNAFSSIEEERKHLIYNYQTTYTGILGSAFEECYMFP